MYIDDPIIVVTNLKHGACRYLMHRIRAFDAKRGGKTSFLNRVCSFLVLALGEILALFSH